MHVSYRDIADNADFWRVNIDLGAAATALTTIVTPRPFLAGPLNIGGQPTVMRRPQLVLHGFCYTYIGGAANSGFNLVFENIDPSYAEEQWEERVGANGDRGWGHHDNLCWPLRPPGDGSPSLPADGTTGAVIRLQRVNAVTSGTLQLWGTHTMNDYGNKAYGSPVVYGT